MKITKKMILVSFLMFGGCVSVQNKHDIAPSLQIGIPVAEGATGGPGRVDYKCSAGHNCEAWTNIPVSPDRCYLRLREKIVRDGNTYTIQFFAPTNAPLVDTGDPEWDANSAFIRTNRWPSKRNHIWLSVDGGTNWTKIGHGIPVQKDLWGGEFKWSPPNDYSYLTEQAKLRITNQDGTPFNNGPTNMAFNLPPGKFVESFTFGLYGAIVDVPTWGQITYFTGPMTVTFRQAGGGSIWDVGWISQADCHFHPITTISNVVAGVNTVTISNSIPRAAEVELVIWSASDRVIRGHSKPFEVD